VARLAGVPDAIIERARHILRNLEENELTDAGEARLAAADGSGQLALFADDRLRQDLAAIDTERLTPVEALNRLHELVERAPRVGPPSIWQWRRRLARPGACSAFNLSALRARRSETPASTSIFQSWSSLPPCINQTSVCYV
jgi:hypothetical protein